MADLRTRVFSALRDGAGPGGWMRDSGWTVLDQGLFAGSNFVVNVLLARWLVPEAYGAFTVAFVVFLLVGTIHGGLLIEPMLVFGPGRFKGRLAAYLRVLLRAHAGYAVVAGAALALVGAVTWASGGEMLAQNFLALAVAQGFILALWMMRRACYIESRPAWAASAGALYLVLLVGGAFGLSHVGWLSGPSALGLMAFGSGVVALLLAARLGVFRRADRSDADLEAEAKSEHVTYGRWAGSTGVLEWGRGALPFLVLPLFVGLQGSGTLRALYNLAMPALQAFSALTVLALPAFVRARADGRLRPVVTRVSGGLIGLGVLYAVFILALGRPLLDWLYDGQYSAGWLSLVLLAVLPLASVTGGLLMSLLRSAERPRAVFRARAWGVGVAASVGTALAATLGVAGALASDLISVLTEAVVMRRSLGTEAAPAKTEPTHRLRVLVSSFACAPNQGSEPSVGWNFVREMARYHDVTVLTYGAYRNRIEAYLAERPLDGVEFAYYVLPFEDPSHSVEGVERTGIREQLHYFAWQRGAAAVARRLHRERSFDLAHHVTFVKYWAPSALAGLGIPFIWGPVGGGESAPRSFYPEFSPSGRRYERQRDLARGVMEWSPSVRRTARRADLAFATTDETRERVEALGASNVEVRSAIGLPRSEIEALGTFDLPDDGPLRFLCIGRQIAFKGFRFGILAFVQALASAEAAGDRSLDAAELWLIGDGPEHDNLKALVAQLDLGDRVRLVGVISREEVLQQLQRAHALIHPSMHESGGGVCLEAMAAGRPVVGFALGGTAVHVGPEAGILVPATDAKDAISQLAEAIRTVAASPERRRDMGRAGRQAVSEQFCWEDKVADMAERYWSVADRPRLHPDPAPEPHVLAPA